MTGAVPPRIQWAAAADADLLLSWDAFIRGSPRGHYCQLSTWLGSFRPYGFTFEVLIARLTGSEGIVGGAGVLWFGIPPFRLAVIPFGPIVDVGYESMAQVMIDALSARCRSRGSPFLQIRIPRPATPSDSTPIALLGPDVELSLPGSREGAPFPAALAPARMLWVEFGKEKAGETWPDAILKRFSPNTRRDIRVSERSGVELVEAKSADELRSAYSLIEDNGKLRGYATRSWRDFGPTLQEQVSRGHAVMLTAVHQGRPIGAQYGVVAGQRYSSVMGGTARVDPRLNVGRFLHWKAIERAHEMGLMGYDLTSRGSPGVAQVKMGFRPENIALQRPVCVVFGRRRTGVLLWAHSRLLRHKTTMAAALSRIRRLATRP